MGENRSSNKYSESSKRTFLQELLAIATGFGLASTAQASPAGADFQPTRRPGMEGKRFGMLVDMRKCIGCQACTVSCSVENQPPIGQFRTTVLQYEVNQGEGSAGVPGAGHLPAHRWHRVGGQRALCGLRLLRAGLPV